MDKLSIYDLFSFLLPGVVFSYLILQFLPTDIKIFHSVGQFADGLIYSIVSLILGLIIHRFNFYLLNFKWYKFLLYPSISTVVYDPLKNIDFSEVIKNNDFVENPELFFDQNYYFLEKEGKNVRIEAFQGFYFFLRNLFWVVLFSCIGFVFFQNAIIIQTGWLFFVVVVSFILWLIRNLALFYRSKMIERVLNLSIN